MQVDRPNVGPDPRKVYVGWDPREVPAYLVALRTMRARSSVPLSITALRLHDLELAGLMRRERSRLAKGRPMLIGSNGITRRITTSAQRGTLWDHVSQAPMATEFACSRFLTPLLAQTGWALFVDCDVVFLADVAELFAIADRYTDRYAVMCVQHGHLTHEGLKMDGQPQLPYARKNWSSVMLFNCDHPANRGLTLQAVNQWPGRDLHRFGWLQDEFIGALPPEWNWLVGVQPRPAAPKLAHFTLGGPWLSAWEPREHDDLWLECAKTGVGTCIGDRDARGSTAPVSD